MGKDSETAAGFRGRECSNRLVMSATSVGKASYKPDVCIPWTK